jgi:integrase
MALNGSKRSTRGGNKLTDTGLKRVRLVEGKALVQDGGGLRGVVTETRSGRAAHFVYRLRMDGARVDMRLGTWPKKSLAELRELRDKARELVNAGQDPREVAREEKAQAVREKAEREARRTLRAAFEKWNKLHLRHAYKDGGAEVRRHFDKDILPALGDLPAEQLARKHVAQVVDGVLERGAARTAALVLTYLRQFCRWSAARGYIEQDPTAAFRKADIPTKGPRERTLCDSELRDLARKLPEAGLPKWAPPAVWLLLATAARAGELLRARWEYVDLDRAKWLIPTENAKNARSHLVHLSSLACTCFRELQQLREGPWVIAGRPIPTESDAEPHPVDIKALAKLLKDRQRPRDVDPLKKRTQKHAQGLILQGGPWTAHDLRRTAATLMQELGVLPAVIEKCLNHTEPVAIRRVYQRSEYVPERRDAFNRLGNHLENLIRGEADRMVAPCA